MTAFTMTVAPSVEPVVLSDAKLQARIDTTADDTLVTALITGARQWAERYTGRAFVTQTWQLWLDTTPDIEAGQDGVHERSTLSPKFGFVPRAGYVVLSRPPLVSVNSVTSFDDSDNATVFDPSNYYVDSVREPARLVLRNAAVWPTALRCANGMMIEYITGYGSDGSNVPEPIKTAIRQLVSHWYENRGEAWSDATRAPRTMPLEIEALLSPYVVRNAGV